jgi:glycosyltransferase involved in cell wall biosynthesis
MVLDLDATDGQLEEMAEWYQGRPPKSGMAARTARAAERVLRSRVTLFTPWSEWAAKGLRSAGISSDRISVIPPGVDLTRWRAGDREPAVGRRLRMLFVGGDFRRKGGDMLLDVMRSSLSDRLELDIVTRDAVIGAPNTRVHRLETNSPELRSLYHRADLFVMPSRAECFGIAAVEAMAAGLPVLMTDAGAASEIVDHGRTGWIVKPDVESIVGALTNCVDAPESLPPMGSRGRDRATELFDGERQHRRVVDTVLGLCERCRSSQ